MQARAATYLDSNAGAPLRPEVRAALHPLLSPSDPSFTSGALIANPSSIHAHGRRAKRLLAEAREAIGASLSTDSEQLVFTSSGTEANQLAIRSVLEKELLEGRKPHWITTPVEHDSTLQMIEWVKRRGGEVSLLPVDARGRVSASDLEACWTPRTRLVSLVWVNNETGVINDVTKFSRPARERGALVHLDAAQAWGKLPVAVEQLGAQLVTFSAHKIGALAGTGLLWTGRGGPSIEGTVLGKQEKGRRGGTENLLGIVAAGAAAQALRPAEWAGRVEQLRNRLEDAIRQRVPGTLVNGEGAPRVANTLNLCFEGVESEGLVMALDLAGYCVSAGSACASGTLEPSHVLLAMGRTPEQAMSAIRISLVGDESWEILEGFVAKLEEVVIRVRKSR